MPANGRRDLIRRLKGYEYNCFDYSNLSNRTQYKAYSKAMKTNVKFALVLIETISKARVLHNHITSE
jgi:hypothetical protein